MTLFGVCKPANFDREIDRLVYKLYELTDDEIAIVEGKAGKRRGQRVKSKGKQ